MPALFIYLIKVNVALLIFCLGYYLVLRHLTFYTLNRIYLVTAIVFSTLYPKINLSAYINRHQEIARPIQVVIVNWQQPVSNVVVHNQWYWLQLVFWIGVCLFGIRLLTQLLSLYRLHKNSEPAQLHQYMIRVIKGNINPFSFWRNIYINPGNHPPHELKAILAHEQIHVNQWHTLDILLSELSAIFYWFNPGIWLMKKAIRENIEFITDRKILQKGMDSKAYQYSLINVNFGAQSNAIVNHFNISTIKKRIIMMNAKRSSSVNLTRYVFLIPAVMLLLLIFSVSKAELNGKVARGSASVVKAIKAAAIKIGFPYGQMQHQTPMIKTDSLPKNTSKPAKIDTSKKLTVKVIRKDGEAPQIYINGVKSTEQDLQKLGPDKVAAMYVKKGMKPGSINIFTKGNGTTVFNGYADIDTLIKTTSGKGNVKRIIIKRDTNFTATGHGSHVKNNSYSYTITDGDTLKNGQPGTVIIKDFKIRTGGGVADSDMIAMGPPAIVVRGYGSSSGSSKIDHFSDKLIILNGKEVTQKQFKKVSAADIESISVLKGRAATDKYGDKGKNGVLIITTKK